MKPEVMYAAIATLALTGYALNPCSSRWKHTLFRDGKGLIQVRRTPCSGAKRNVRHPPYEQKCDLQMVCNVLISLGLKADCFGQAIEISW
jgi:hypothetical protein